MPRSLNALLGCLTAAGALFASTPAIAGEFAALDRMAADSRFGVQTDFTHDGGGDMLPRTEIFGRYQVDRNLGVYAQFPIVHLMPVQGDGETAMGNLEMGAHLRIPLGGARVVFRIGAALPTSHLEDRNGEALMRNAWPRLTDYAQQLPETTSIRASISPMASAGAFFFRADLGADVLLDAKDRDSRLLLRGNLGVGAWIKSVALTAEFVNLGNADELAEDAFAHSVSVSVRHGVLYTAMTAPVDDDRLIYAWTVGVQAHP